MARVERTHVVSSAIRSVGYDEATMMLDIEFADGDVYRYQDVPPAFYRLLLRSASKGSFVNTYIASGDFRFTRLPPSE
jgi:hypothetical protein